MKGVNEAKREGLFATGMPVIVFVWPFDGMLMRAERKKERREERGEGRGEMREGRGLEKEAFTSTQ